MSFEAAAWAIAHPDVSTVYERVVLIILADCHNSDTGRCDPSIQFVSQRACVSRSTVIRTLESLEKKGLIQREKRASAKGLKTANQYRLNVVSDGHNVVSQRHPVVSDRHLGSVSQTPTVVSHRHPNQEEENQEVNQGERTRLCPVDFVPDPDQLRMTRIPPGVDVDLELEKFRNHEFLHPKSDWNRAFAKWLASAQPARNDGRNDLQRKTDELLGF